MKIRLLVLLFTAFCLISLSAQNNLKEDKKMDRIELCKKNFSELFTGEALTGKGTDPELMDILQKFIFGEIFETGNLDHKMREMITLITLATQQTLPQLQAHANAALNIGITPIELREIIYQCAPFIGFPKTLNAIAAVNEVFKEREIPLPLEKQGTVTEENRYIRGNEIQYPIYGDEIKETMKTLPGTMKNDVPRFLTEMCFGDFYTRNGLDIKTRELLILCVLATLGANEQIQAHSIGNSKVGNSKETQIAAIVQCLPYIGFPNALNAIRIVNSTNEAME
ncbi:MAG: carboxymuconolactone decarboxylase family protein [Bacteroidales bacterium]|nr:carboxymuconolactone decarboxylase family protein [Bacteroidales bacterium]